MAKLSEPATTQSTPRRKAELGTVVGELPFESPLNSLDWSPDGTQLAVLLTNGKYTIWSWPELRELDRGAATAIAWHPSGRLTLASEGGVHFSHKEERPWGARRRLPPISLAAKTRLILAGQFVALRWSPEGSSLGAVDERAMAIHFAQATPGSDFQDWTPVERTLPPGPFALGPNGAVAYAEGRRLFMKAGTGDPSENLLLGELDGALRHITSSRSDGWPLFVATHQSLYSFRSGPDVRFRLSRWNRAEISTMGLDPSGELLAMGFGERIAFAAADAPELDLHVATSPRGNAFDVQCHPREEVWAWACGNTVVFMQGPAISVKERVWPPEAPPPTVLTARDLPLLAYHLVLAGHARPDLLQDFSPDNFDEAISRAQPNVSSAATAAATLLTAARSATDQPQPLWLAWVRTARKADLENAAGQLSSRWERLT